MISLSYVLSFCFVSAAVVCVNWYISTSQRGVVVAELRFRGFEILLEDDSTVSFEIMNRMESERDIDLDPISSPNHSEFKMARYQQRALTSTVECALNVYRGDVLAE